MPDAQLNCCVILLLTSRSIETLSRCVQMSECRTDRDEEACVVSRIRDRHSAGVRLSDMAVLFRTAAQGKAFERALVRFSQWET